MSAVTKAYDTVRIGIIKGQYLPHTRITENAVAAEAGVSRTPVREALRRLHAEGLLHFVPNQGAVVTHWSDADVEDIFELRSVLESYGVRRAVRRATKEQVVELRMLAGQQFKEARQRRAGYLERIPELNSRFHQLLQTSAGNERLTAMLAALVEAPLILRTFRDYTQSDLMRSAGHHLEIVQALEARDEDWAASIMTSHILSARRLFRLNNSASSNSPPRGEAHL